MFNDTVGWLASDPSGGFAVMIANGYKPEKVSTDALESAFTQWPNLAHATAMTYTQDAHPFYMLNAPAQQTSVCFDGETGAWHDRAWLAEDGSFERWRGEVNTFGFQRHLVGDFEDGRVYDMRLDYYLDDERDIVRVQAHAESGSHAAAHPPQPVPAALRCRRGAGRWRHPWG